MSEMLAEKLSTIVRDPYAHAKFLNTLAFMENAGARKISKFEHKTSVSLLILKHAAEEHRHAYYLKKQIGKLGQLGFESFEDRYLIAPQESRYYLDLLDVHVCKYVKTHFGLSGYALKWAAYLFVTYAIEVRADELYPIYQNILQATDSKIQVKSIIVEEEGHLEEMISQLQSFAPNWEIHAQAAIQLESTLFRHWVNAL
jgi:bacterioferritin (cytochrome b1)